MNPNIVDEPESQSAEDVFWKDGLKRLADAKVGKAMGVKLVRMLDNNFQEAMRIIESALKTQRPAAYLGKVMSNLRENTVPIRKTAKKEPAWLAEKRGLGATVAREGHLWRISGDLYNDKGDVVGC